MICERARYKRRSRLLLCGDIIFLCCLSPHLLAQQTQLSLQDAIKQALAGNPELGAAQAQADVARGQVTQAGLRPNPRITVQTEDLRPGTQEAPFSLINSSEDYLFIGQVIETGGKRGNRIRVANSALGVTEAERDVTRRQIEARVSAAYWNAVLTRRVRDLTDQSLKTYEEDVNYISHRVQEGVAAEADLIRLQIERDRVRAAAQQADRDSNQTLVSLFRAMGKTEFPEVVLTGNLESREPQNLPSFNTVLESRPEISLARKTIQEAENDLKLQHSVAKPDPEVFLGYKRNIGYDTAYAAVQMDLPIHNRNQGNISSAEARLRLAQSRLRVSVASARADYESAIRAYRDQQTLIAGLPALVAQAEESERRARAAYREGSLELLRLLDAERSRIQSEVEYVRALADLQQSITTLRFVSGAEISGEAGK